MNFDSKLKKKDLFQNQNFNVQQENIRTKKNVSLCLGSLGQGKKEVGLGGSFLLKGSLGISRTKNYN